MTSDSADPRLHTDRVPIGILFMLGATVMYAGSTALSKWQVASYSFAEVLFFRSFVSLIVVALLILPRHGLQVFRTQRLRDHAGRSATQSVAQSFILIALSLMPIAGAVAINFSAPLFATLFAALWLKAYPHSFISIQQASILPHIAGLVRSPSISGPGGRVYISIRLRSTSTH